jgi:myb proto-oncogene protein
LKLVFLLVDVIFSPFYHLLQVQNCYKIKKETSLVTKSPSSKQKAVRPQQQSSASDDMLDFAADTAAYIVAEAENKSYLAVEAVKETERISRLAEENDAMLLLAEQLYEQCNVDKYSFLVTEF